MRKIREGKYMTSVEWFAFLVFRSSRDQISGRRPVIFTEFFHDITQSLQANAGFVPQFGSKPPRSTLLPSLSSPITLTSDTIPSELLTASEINKRREGEVNGFESRYGEEMKGNERREKPAVC
jgi:hypothetical protein